MFLACSLHVPCLVSLGWLCLALLGARIGKWRALQAMWSYRLKMHFRLESTIRLYNRRELQVRVDLASNLEMNHVCRQGKLVHIGFPCQIPVGGHLHVHLEQHITSVATACDAPLIG